MKINTNSKNFRIILFSVIGLAVLAAVVLVLTLTAPDDGSDDDQNVTETTTADPALMLQPEDKGKIESIYIENPVGSFTVKKAVNKSGEDIWIIEGYEDIKESLWVQSSFDSLVDSLTGMSPLVGGGKSFRYRTVRSFRALFKGAGKLRERRKLYALYRRECGERVSQLRYDFRQRKCLFLLQLQS